MKITAKKFLIIFHLKDALDGPKPMTAFKSFDNQNRREIPFVPARGKSVLSAFFAKPKIPKASYVSWLLI